MPRLPSVSALCVLLVAACSTTDGVAPGASKSIEGTIAAIDTQPWAYDGHAVIEIDTARDGRVPVTLPARWNLCKAGPVDVEALAVGMRVRATGAPAAESGLVVCEHASHRVVPID